MTRKYVNPGETMPYTASGADVASGTLVVIGHLLGVTLGDIADGETGTAAIEGVFEGVPKVAAAVFTAGEKLIYDVSAGAFADSAATPASGDITGGAVAIVAGANAETTCTIKLTPGNTTKTA
jgi:predicted RecA/RadA family phage recombinase